MGSEASSTANIADWCLDVCHATLLYSDLALFLAGGGEREAERESDLMSHEFVVQTGAERERERYLMKNRS